MANKFTLRNYRAYNNVTDVYKVAANTIATAKGEVISINSSTFAVTVSSAPAVGEILVTRDYPNYSIPLGRYNTTQQTPIATSTGEIVGIKLRAGDVVVKSDGTLFVL